MFISNVTLSLSEFDQLRRDADTLTKIRKAMFDITIFRTQTYETSSGIQGGIKVIKTDPYIKDQTLIKIKELVDL